MKYTKLVNKDKKSKTRLRQNVRQKRVNEPNIKEKSIQFCPWQSLHNIFICFKPETQLNLSMKNYFNEECFPYRNSTIVTVNFIYGNVNLQKLFLITIIHWNALLTSIESAHPVFQF